MTSKAGTEPTDLVEDVTKLLWKYVLKLEKVRAIRARGNVEFQCHFCKGKYKGTYSTVRAHLFRQPGSGIRSYHKITSSQLQEVQKHDSKAKHKKGAWPFKKILFLLPSKVVPINE